MTKPLPTPAEAAAMTKTRTEGDVTITIDGARHQIPAHIARCDCGAPVTPPNYWALSTTCPKCGGSGVVDRKYEAA